MGEVESVGAWVLAGVTLALWAFETACLGWAIWAGRSQKGTGTRGGGGRFGA